MIRPRSSLLPTDRKWPEWTIENLQLRKKFYARIKSEPRTAMTLSEYAGRPVLETIDELRLLENYGVIRHRADDLGVVFWHFVPDNKWEAEEPPF
jgi:hypothetical protein